MEAKPVTLAEANRFVGLHHRHSLPRHSWKWGVGLKSEDGELYAVAMAGRPVARMLDDGYTLEVLRVCTDGTANAVSHLYGRIARAAKALGYRRLVTYTLETESGVSPRAAGFTAVRKTGDRDWGCPSRPNQDMTLFGRKQPDAPRIAWERKL